MGILGVHYDLTDLCNAGCPQCARTDPRGCKPNDWLARRVASLADFRRYSPPEFLAGLEYAYFCGNYGDPAVAPDLPGILRYCWEANPGLKLSVYSNASIRPAEWWRDLGRLATGRRFRVIAAIDGASQETNRRYRVRTDFARIMANMAAFIDAGGTAEWWMLVFRHNEHEVERAREMAAERGFAGFRAYPSNRFGGKPSFTYSHRGEEFTLEPPLSRHKPKAATTHQIAAEDLPRMEAFISCEARRKSEAFIDFDGYLTPCCHIGRRLYMRRNGVFAGADPWIGEVFEDFDMRRLNIDTAGFAAALAAHDAFLEHLEPRWAEQQPHVCKVVCGRKRPAAAA